MARAPRDLGAVRAIRRSTVLAAVTPIRSPPAPTLDLDQALQAMLESCPVPDHLRAFAEALADPERTEI